MLARGKISKKERKLTKKGLWFSSTVTILSPSLPCFSFLFSPGVAHDDDADLSVSRLQLLESGNDEHGRLPHAALGLAHHVHPEDRLWYALVLNCEGERKG